MQASSLRRTQPCRRGALLTLPALAAAAALSLAACSPSAASPASGPQHGGTAAPSSSTRSAPAGSAAALAVHSTSLGTILSDGRGFTVYAFDADRDGMSTCSGACAAAWPPVTTTSTSPQIDTGVTQSLVGQTTRDDGTTQLTYANRPLYLFTGDNAPGDTNGDGSTGFGARWDALTATGEDASHG
jgi:predicted lipoprotein with Yx(FWY)xxD motif